MHLAYLGAYLEQHGIEVKIIDEIAGDNVEQDIDTWHPDIAGITATTPLAPYAYKIADKCREKGILTVLGGYILQ